MKRLSLFLVAALVLVACGGEKEPVKVNPAFSKYISAFTSGMISSESTIKIKFSEAKMVEEMDLSDLFDFSPGIDGHTAWLDDRTLEFIPEERLPGGETINVSFAIGDMMTMPDGMEEFEFQFQVVKQNFLVEVSNLSPYDPKNFQYVQLRGSVISADVIDAMDMAEVFEFNDGNKNYEAYWTTNVSRKSHEFVVDSLERTEAQKMLSIAWDGSAIDQDISGSMEQKIPALSDFSILNAEVIQQPNQMLKLVFSDPLDPRQDLRGLVRIDNKDFRDYSIENNVVKIFPDSRLAGWKQYWVSPDIKNSLGYTLDKELMAEVQFENIKPAVKFLGDGQILPNSDNLKVAFEAVNLRAVDLRIIEIYEDNVGQFLQVNYLGGDSELKRVGRLIRKEKIELSTDNTYNFSKWNTFSFNLDDYINTTPGAIYRVELSFKKAYSLYLCEGSSLDEDIEEEENWDEDESTELSYWDGVEGYYSDYDPYYYGGYDWDNMDNPCHKAYYGGRRSAKRNILASNLGVIAQRGEGEIMQVYVTDLRTTEPVSGADVQIMNFQQQVIGTGQTDGQGMMSLPVDGKPFLLVATSGEEVGYMRLDDGSSLSLSRFDVAGSVVQKGLKGFIYGERGVWRPGDSLFLQFILEDKTNTLPDEHPVVMEIYNPRGQMTRRMVRTTGVNGFYDFRTSTSTDDPTGNWRANVKVGGASFTKYLKIEDIKPNRLKINIDFGQDEISASDGGLVQGTLESKWLHGATAAGLKAAIESSVRSTSTEFPKYSDFTFTDPVRKYDSESETIYEGTLNTEGKSSFAFELDNARYAPGKLRATFTTRVFEKGGAYSIDQYSMNCSPFDRYVGLKLPKGDKARGMLLTDTDHEVKVVTVDENGNPVSVPRLKAEVYKVEWRWWWNAEEDNFASYIGSRDYRPLVSKELSTTNGEGSFKFQIKYPDWGRYLVRITDPNGGHATGKAVYIDWPGWAGRARKDNPGGASMLTFSTDKEKYTVGDEITATIPTAEGGKLLVTVENGTEVLSKTWYDTQPEQTEISLEATEAHSPNAYLHITYLQKHAQTVNDLPIRLYGIVPLMVEDPNTKLSPTINMPDELMPEQEFTVEVSEENGKDMTYTIAVVDEGLLDLTRFKTPDAHRAFYAREALGVKTWDLYDRVIGAYAGKLNELLAAGGDDEVGKKDEGAKRFKPVVKFLGPFEYTGGTEEHTIKLPNYIGSVRTMVVAGQDAAYGKAEKATPVKKPLMVMTTLPRVLGPGEEIELPVSVFAMEDDIRNVTVRIEGNGIFEIDQATKKLTFDQMGDQLVYFNVRIKDKIGIGKIKVTAKGGGETSSEELEIDVRNPNPIAYDSRSVMLEAGASQTLDYAPLGMTGTNEVEVEFSNLPPLNLGRRLKSLIGYPHGCAEQTTSKAFPQLYLSGLFELNGDEKKRADYNVQEAIRKLMKFQVSSGGFGYWPGDNSARDWISSYAGHFLLEADRLGYEVPTGFRSRWIQYQTQQSNRWNGGRESNLIKTRGMTQAYRLYALALADAPSVGAMNRLKKSTNASTQAKWILAATYALIGKKDVAEQLAQKLNSRVTPYNELGYTYGSSTRDQSVILMTMLDLDWQDKAFRQLELVSKDLNSARWLSTQSTAFALVAISKFQEKFGSSKVIKADWKWNGKGDLLSTDQPLSKVELAGANQAGSLNISNQGTGPLYVNLIRRGVQKAGDEEAVSSDLRITVSYFDLEGNRIDVTQLNQGQDFMADVSIVHPGTRNRYENMALSQIFPSGWEIRNQRVEGFSEQFSGDKPDYQDIRDDRVYSYFDLNRSKMKRIRVVLNAAYLGKYYHPGVVCEAMYDNNVQARTKGFWVEVKSANAAIQ